MTTADAILSDGGHCQLSIAMRGDWSMEATLADSSRNIELRLQAVVPDAENGLLFLYAPADPVLELTPGIMAGPLPANASELLLYAPTVALRKCEQGFMLLSWQVWKDIAAAPGREYGAVSSLVESCQLSLAEDCSSESESESLGVLSQAAMEDLEENYEEEEDDDCEDLEL